jgi:ABC-type uncharacterized transport system auxiliary subunit
MPKKTLKKILKKSIESQQSKSNLIYIRRYFWMEKPPSLNFSRRIKSFNTKFSYFDR